jgi:hypothetical protein
MADADHLGERGEVERLDHPIGERLGLRVVEILRFGARETLGNGYFARVGIHNDIANLRLSTRNIMIQFTGGSANNLDDMRWAQAPSNCLR